MLFDELFFTPLLVRRSITDQPNKKVHSSSISQLLKKCRTQQCTSNTDFIFQQKPLVLETFIKLTRSGINQNQCQLVRKVKRLAVPITPFESHILEGKPFTTILKPAQFSPSTSLLLIVTRHWCKTKEKASVLIAHYIPKPWRQSGRKKRF